ncbi:glycosyltransferase family 1 protein [Pectobacterium carotovorum]|uniref:glycosyltransferase family 4 protein n=1 Tax=Pectobacterium carotovorum TaxID=554 RepID=UPI000E7201B0|nr:glycosyltransferase family 4 protein [Pectobacterium carotovorum]RJL38789.1 glycosyltransferase family 1 protein [Pectobacterium carotovorum]
MKLIAISANTSWYIYNFRANTIKKLLMSGYSVLVVSPKDQYSSKLINLGCDYIDININARGKNPLSDLYSLFLFIKLYKNKKPDLILNFTPKNNIYSAIAARINKIPVINNIAGLGTVFVNDSVVCQITRLLYRISQPKVNKIFFQNSDDRDLFLRYKISPENNTELLPGSGVDLERFKYTPTLNDGKIRFLLVARMLYEKGITYYAEVAKKLKEKYGEDVEFRLLGFVDETNKNSISKNSIEQWVNDGFIIYLGTSDQVEEEIRRVDCVVLPSFYREGIPRSLLEAAAMGKPLITTDNVGCKETVVNNVNGFLCEPRSVDSLSTAIDKMIQLSHEQRITMGIESRSMVEDKFDEKIVIAKYINAIEKLIS